MLLRSKDIFWSRIAGKWEIKIDKYDQNQPKFLKVPEFVILSNVSMRKYLDSYFGACIKKSVGRLCEQWQENAEVWGMILYLG